LLKLLLFKFFGSVQNECTFSTLAFVKLKFYNHLAKHLEIVMGMYS